MTAFLDTSVLVATFYEDHEYHERSLDLFLRLKKRTAFTASHCLAEFYSVVTGMPAKKRASPNAALLFIDDVSERLTCIALEPGEYREALSNGAEYKVFGGAIYDALLGHCAVKANANILYTWNLKHFQRLGPKISSIVRTPA